MTQLAISSAGLAACALFIAASPAPAATLEVGAGKQYPLPSAAAAAAHDGDHVLIADGSYFDCAFWRANDLVIEGESAAGTVITDKTCAGKALFITDGRNITIRHLTLARARVPDGNGAGIRAEARDLTIDDVRFVNSQDGILSGADGGFLRIANSAFIADGISLDGAPTHAVIAGRLDLLRIETSRFAEARGGDAISSDADRTELVGNTLIDEGGHMTGPMIHIGSGALTLQDNTVTLAPGAAERPGIVLVTGDATAIGVRGNTLAEPPGASVPLLRNWGGVTAEQAGNTTPHGVAAVSEEGAEYHRLRARLAALREDMHHEAGKMRHLLGELYRRFN